ncbi:MAG: PH domain-containing protein, partial [Candidatus Dormibacteraeota bacterium]|nr:PH domain-containing protein [Candidatus Dormibacteraeota bacterium]
RGVLAHVVIGSILLVAGVVSWIFTRWRVDNGDLWIEAGLLRRSSQRFPLTQVQAIDIVRPLLARGLGLAELRLRMGGATGGSGRLAYLPAGQANTVRAELLALGQGRAGAVAGQGLADLPAPPVEGALVALQTARLVASILLSRAAVVALVAAVALAVVQWTAAQEVVPILGSSGAGALGLLTVLWRRFNGNYRLRVVDAADGLRLSSGLLETTAETIPKGRIQAVRMLQPLLWRPLGWCRVEVDVAGRQHRGEENAAEGRQLRAVLPVGTRAEAAALLSVVLPGVPTDRARPPTRARWKSPLRFHYLAWGVNADAVVTTSGRFSRVTAWVPLNKVQSLRRIQGPVQRCLKLSTIYLDTAGRSVHSAIRDRDAFEAERILSDLTLACRDARRAGGPTPGRPAS